MRSRRSLSLHFVCVQCSLSLLTQHVYIYTAFQSFLCRYAKFSSATLSPSPSVNAVYYFLLIFHLYLLVSSGASASRMAFEVVTTFHVAFCN